MMRPSSATASARCGLLCAVVAFVLLTAGFLCLIGTTHPELADPEYGIRLKRIRKHQREEPERPLVLMLGSSRMQMGLNPVKFGSLPRHALAFNAAQSGGGPNHCAMNYDRYHTTGIQPQAIVLELIPALLTRDIQAPQPPYGGWLPWIDYRANLISYLGGGRFLPTEQRTDYLWKQMKPYGWMPYFHETITEDKREHGLAQAHAEYAARMHQATFDPVALTAIDRILKLARLQQIPVLVLFMPESPRFQSWRCNAHEHAVQEYLSQLRVKAEVYDGRMWTSDEADFADGHHLMKAAAERFSQHFGETVLAPWLQRTGQAPESCVMSVVVGRNDTVQNRGYDCTQNRCGPEQP